MATQSEEISPLTAANPSFTVNLRFKSRIARGSEKLNQDVFFLMR